MNRKKIKQLRQIAFYNWLELNKASQKSEQDYLYDRSYEQINTKDASTWYFKSIKFSEDGTESKVAPSAGNPFSRKAGIPAIFQYKTYTQKLVPESFRRVLKVIKKQYKNNIEFRHAVS